MFDADFDGLGICPVCGDVETPGGRLCRSCDEQRQIDNDPNPPPSQMATTWSGIMCEDCGAPYIPGTGQATIFGGWFCNDCLD
jgi:hypothetical protein